MGRPANTYEAHRSRQFHCHSRRLSLSGTPATASASHFLRELCVGSPLPVREPTSFQQRRKQDGYQQQTREHAAMRQHQSDDLAECQREAFFATTFSRPFKDQSGAWLNGTSFSLNDLEALVNVTRETKEWIATPALKR